MNTYMNDGVGKRIVDALKKQSEVEFNQNFETSESTSTVENIRPENIVGVSNSSFQAESQFVSKTVGVNTINNIDSNNQSQNFEFSGNIGTPNMYSSQNIYTDVSQQEMPANVVVLKQLVSQLPTGVSRQAGALVIKQTMEALGISMKSVLQEAQQMQESLNISAHECQNSIIECKKQISMLESQAQQYQRQSASLNEIVSLFLQLH